MSTAIGSAISNIPIIPLSDIYTIYTISSATHNFLPVNLTFYPNSYAIPFQNKYFVFGRISFQNGYSQGALITNNSPIQLTVSANKNIYPTMISILISGFIGLTSLYSDNLDNFWVNNLRDDILFDSSKTMIITFCGWMDK